jgi:hypothetical protein
MFSKARTSARIRSFEKVSTASDEGLLVNRNSDGQAQSFRVAPFQRLRWGTALLIVVISAGFILFCLAAGSHPVCQVTTVTEENHAVTTENCGLPGPSNYGYLVAVVVLLLLPDAKSIKVGGFEFERLTGEIKEQADQIHRLSQRISQVSLQASQVTQLVTVVAELGKEVVGGDTPEASRSADDVLGPLLGPH